MRSAVPLPGGSSSLARLASLSNPIKALVGLAAAGVLCVAYGILVERRWYRLRRYRLAILPPGAEGVTILHLSDLHLTVRRNSLVRFLATLPQPDVTAITGDLLGEPAAVETVVEALRPLRGRLGSYVVLGSNDYYAPRPLNYMRYFMRRRRVRVGVRGRAPDLVAMLEADGWRHIGNRRTTLEAGEVPFEVLGFDDAHIKRHDLRLAPRTLPEAFGLVVTHSPDPAPELASFGWDLIVAGHTHGGQVRMPFVGALVTNGHMPTRLAMGLAKIPPSVLHVSPGLGTSKYAPFRFLCRPEATLLELRAREDGHGGAAAEAAEAAQAAPEASARSNTRS